MKWLTIQKILLNSGMMNYLKMIVLPLNHHLIIMTMLVNMEMIMDLKNIVKMNHMVLLEGQILIALEIFTLHLMIISGSVIKAWDIVLRTMKVGEVAKIACKPEYAYGNAGTSRNTPRAAVVENDDEDADVLELKDRLAAYNLESSPELTSMDTETQPEVPAKKPPGQKSSNKAQSNNSNIG